MKNKILVFLFVFLGILTPSFFAQPTPRKDNLFDRQSSIQKWQNDYQSAICFSLWADEEPSQDILANVEKLIIEAKQKDESPIYLAIKLEQLALAKEYMRALVKEKGADINFQDSNGNTPLHLAVNRAYFYPILELIKILLYFGADLTTQNNHGRTALHLAAKSGNLEIVHLLSKRNTEVAIQDKCGRIPLHLAIESGNFLTIKYLLNIGSNENKNIKDQCGQTALHLAVGSGGLLAIKYLLEQGADANIKDNRGQTPLDLATQLNKSKMIHLLKTLIAKKELLANIERASKSSESSHSVILLRNNNNAHNRSD